MSKNRITADEARQICRGPDTVSDMLESVYGRIRKAAEADNWFMYPCQQIPRFDHLSNSEKQDLFSVLKEDGFEISNRYTSQCCIQW